MILHWQHCSKIKRKLPDPDDQDDLLDEIKDVARAFFQRKKRAANSNSTVQPVRQTPPPPPPPLQMFPQQQQQQEQGSGDMTSQYSTVNYLTDGSSGATYMPYKVSTVLLFAYFLHLIGQCPHRTPEICLVPVPYDSCICGGVIPMIIVYIPQCTLVFVVLSSFWI